MWWWWIERVGICITITAACRVKFLEGTVVLDMPEATGTKSWNHRRLKEIVLPYIEFYLLINNS